MSRGRGYAEFSSGLRSELAVDLGEVEDPSASCGASACEENPVYRVLWPSVGGDVAYCSYHLARYRTQHPDIWERVQHVVDDDLSKFTTRGNRFLTFEDLPQTLFDNGFRAAALLVDGSGLYVEVEPEETGTIRRVNRSLEVEQEREIDVDALGEFLAWVEENVGVHTWATEYGGEEE